jgi:hypothetical protein
MNNDSAKRRFNGESSDMCKRQATGKDFTEYFKKQWDEGLKRHTADYAELENEDVLLMFREGRKKQIEQAVGIALKEGATENTNVV